MDEEIVQPGNDQEQDEIKPVILENIQALLAQLKITKVYFVDDAINQDTGKETFKGIVQGIIATGKIAELREIQITGIDFNTDEAVLSEHIDQVWDTLKHAKQLRYFEKAYTIAGTPQAINDLNVSNNLKDFFNNGQIEFLTPNDWDEKHDQILAEVQKGTKILVIFDQDLKLATGRYSEQLVQGEQLILELNQKAADKVIIALLTHTTTTCEQELPKRSEICGRINTLNPSDFFVLAKVRLEKSAMFADGLKKVCLNTYCENIKTQTIGILRDAQKETIRRLEQFDTYDFDHTIFKSSQTEGVWEPETLLRITDVIFKDEVRKLMISNNYLTSTNPAICAANELSKVEFKIDDSVNPYNERFKLRHQEIYEAGELLNGLRKPIDNGDIFTMTEGEKKGKKFILVAQECDLMVREDGKRGTRTAILCEIETFTEKQLHKEISDKYEKEIKKGKFNNHFFADRYKLEYFESGTNKAGLVYFSKTVVVDLNVCDLIVFNDSGEALLDLTANSYDENLYNKAWKERYKLISNEFIIEKQIIEKQYAAIAGLGDANLKTAMQAKFNYLFSFINKLGIQVNYNSDKFIFGLKRIARLRQPKSRNLLDRYYQHLSRIAELHDFAE
ncbi:MAG: hypothetical protein JWN78_2001 [Bacteroidota bacterium]|nr:hypothetical protein [Bacteroidota bacterium]